MQNWLEFIALLGTIILTFAGVVRLLIVSPLDRKLEANNEKLINHIEHRFLDSITVRLDKMEATSANRSRQGILWGKALHAALTKQGLDVPDPEIYRWDPSGDKTPC